MPFGAIAAIFFLIASQGSLTAMASSIACSHCSSFSLAAYRCSAALGPAPFPLPSMPYCHRVWPEQIAMASHGANTTP